MKSIVLVFIITVLFLIGMTKFTNDTNYSEAVRYAELSQYYENLGNITNSNGGAQNGGNGNVFMDSVEIEVSFSGEVSSNRSFKVIYASFMSQAIELMGGLKDDADLRCINMNHVILESSSFYIPGGKFLDKVSINNGTKEELMTLYNVGAVSANRIIEYRSTYGYFTCLEDLLNVNGIGSQTFNKIKDSIIL